MGLVRFPEGARLGRNTFPLTVANFPDLLLEKAELPDIGDHGIA
jgi:hypothetical protein